MVFGGGGGFDLGTAHGRVIIDASGVGSAMSQAQGIFSGGLAGIGDGIARVGQQMAGLGSQLTVLTAPIMAFGVAGITVAADFESAMAEISARTGTTGADLERIKDLALEMGAQTSFSAQQAAEAFLQLLASGQTAEEAIATLPAVLDAAAASGEDLGRTADVVTDIMAAFHLGVEDAGMVVDALARAAGASSADMAGLGQGFANIGPIAAEFGLSVDETASILAIFSENGIKGAEAGTQLRSMLRNMTSDTDKVQGTWRRLGISMFDVQGRARPLQDVMRELSVAMAGMSDQERTRTLADLGGAFGQMGLSALTAGISMEEMQTRMDESASASDVAAARMDTFSGRMESLKGSVETLMIEALTPLMENVLQPLVEQVIEVVNGVTDWVNANPELAGQIALVAGALAIAGPVLIVVGTALGAIGTVIGFILSPIGLLIAGVAALGVAWMTNFGGIRDVVQPIIERLLGILGSAWATIQPGLAAIYDWFITSALPRVRAFVEEVVMPAIDRFIGILGEIWTRVQPGLQNLFDWVVTDGLPLITNVWDTVLRPVIETVIDILMTIWEVVGPALGDLFTWFTETGLPLVTHFIEDVVVPIIQTLVDILVGIWNAVRPHVTALLNWFRDSFQWIGRNFIQPVIDFVNRLISLVGDAIQSVRELLGLNQQAAAGVPAGSGEFLANAGIPTFASGIDFVPSRMLAVLDPGERVLTAAENQRGAGGKGGGINIENLTIHANSEAEGRAAARGFEAEFMERYYARGNG